LHLRNKILIPTVVLIALGMTISATFSHFKSKQMLKDSIGDNIRQIATSTARNLDSWIKGRSLDVATWSQQRIFQSAIPDTFMGKSARKATSQQLGNLKASYGYYENICLATLEGDIVAAADSAVVGKDNVRQSDFFQKAARGENAVSEVVQSKVSVRPVFMFASPVSQKDKVIGVLFGVVDISKLNALFINPIKVGKSGYGYVYNQKGLIIAHPDTSAVMQSNMNDFAFFKDMQGKESGMISHSHKGIEKWVAFNKIRLAGWTVAVAAVSSEILAPVAALGKLNATVTVVMVVVAAISIFMLASILVKPIGLVVAGLSDAAEGEGDLTKRLPVASKDEVGELSNWFNVFIEKVQAIIKDVSENANRLNQSSGNLSSISDLLSEGADQTSSRVQTVMSSSERMSDNLNSVASSMEEAATNINMVASAADEMTATIQEIAQNTENARNITLEAVSQTHTASDQVGKLGMAAQDIGKVVETITEISEQVNLLALNATIEAARAGGAGKGFAVVANEIKELAKQTATATGEIKTRVESTQMSASETVNQISTIAGVVNQVNEIVATIASAVEEQFVNTKEIASNIVNASIGIDEVNKNVSGSNMSAADITAEIAKVTQQASEISSSSSQVSLSANDLSQLAGELNALVEKFKI
jgi:methyl-accepting chemotaxis protein